MQKKNEDFILIDVSSGTYARSIYNQNHLEEAIFADLDALLSEIKDNPSKGGRHPLPSLQKFSKSLPHLGIRVEVHVILYDRNHGALAAGRVWWMHRSVGHVTVPWFVGG